MEYYQVGLKYVNPKIKKLIDSYTMNFYSDHSGYKGHDVKEAEEANSKGKWPQYYCNEQMEAIKEGKVLTFLCGDWYFKESEWYDVTYKHWDWALALDTICVLEGNMLKDIWTGKKYKCEPITKGSNQDIEKHEFILTYDEKRTFSESTLFGRMQDMEKIGAEKVIKKYDSLFEEFKEKCENVYSGYNLAFGFIDNNNSDIISDEAKVKEFLKQYSLEEKDQH